MNGGMGFTSVDRKPPAGNDISGSLAEQPPQMSVSGLGDGTSTVLVGSAGRKPARNSGPHLRHGKSITVPSGSFTVPPMGIALTNSLSVSAKIWCTWAAGRISVSPPS